MTEIQTNRKLTGRQKKPTKRLRMNPYTAERRDVLENTPPRPKRFPRAGILHPLALDTLPREQGVYWRM